MGGRKVFLIEGKGGKEPSYVSKKRGYLQLLVGGEKGENSLRELFGDTGTSLEGKRRERFFAREDGTLPLSSQMMGTGEKRDMSSDFGKGGRARVFLCGERKGAWITLLREKKKKKKKKISKT